MLQLHKIDSLDLPELMPYRTMGQQLEHRRQQIFIAETREGRPSLAGEPLYGDVSAAAGEMARNLGVHCNLPPENQAG